MTTRCPAATDVAATAELDAFLDLLCGDVELLRAEFDDIVAAEWPRPPSRRAVVHDQHGGNGGPAQGTGCLRGTEPSADHDISVDGPCRQRSPPGAPSPTE
jgi:hypothetical protein